MERPYWTNEEILDELVGLNFTEVLDFGTGTLVGTGTRLLCLAHGNIDDDTVMDLYLHIHCILYMYVSCKCPNCSATNLYCIYHIHTVLYRLDSMHQH